jgi:hypothetical protein
MDFKNYKNYIHEQKKIIMNINLEKRAIIHLAFKNE